MRLNHTSAVMRTSRPMVAGRGVLTCLAAMVIASQVAAQEFKFDPVDPKAKELATTAQQCIRNPARFPEDRAKFEAYFNGHYFPEMTFTGPDNLGRLGDARYNLFKKFLWASTNDQLQQRLTELALGYMGKIVTTQNPPYHPAVRYNAILVIGMLDEQYAREGATPRPAKPLPKATKALTAIVDSATTSNRFPPPVILGAVIGLERHAQLHAALDPQAVQAMTAALLKLANHTDPIQDMDRNAFSWLRLRAASALAQLGSVGPNNTVHDAILKLAAGLKSLDDRCTAAAMLGKLQYKDVKVDPATTTEPLFQLARDLGDAEAKRAQEFQDASLGIGTGTGGYASRDGGEGGYYSGEEGEERFPRRHVLARLSDLRTGLAAVKPAVPAETQAKIDAVLAAINPVIVAAVDKGTVELKFTEAITGMSLAITNAAPAANAPAPESEVETF